MSGEAGTKPRIALLGRNPHNVYVVKDLTTCRLVKGKVWEISVSVPMEVELKTYLQHKLREQWTKDMLHYSSANDFTLQEMRLQHFLKNYLNLEQVRVAMDSGGPISLGSASDSPAVCDYCLFPMNHDRFGTDWYDYKNFGYEAHSLPHEMPRGKPVPMFWFNKHPPFFVTVNEHFGIQDRRMVLAAYMYYRCIQCIKAGLEVNPIYLGLAQDGKPLLLCSVGIYSGDIPDNLWNSGWSIDFVRDCIIFNSEFTRRFVDLPSNLKFLLTSEVFFNMFELTTRGDRELTTYDTVLL
jgi:hypothetical protein